MGVSRWRAGAAFALLALALWAGVAKASLTGTLGANTGSSSATSMCPAGTTMTGLSADVDDRAVIARVQAFCSDLSQGQEIGAVGSTSSGFFTGSVCGTGVAVGIYGRSGDVVDAVGPRCGTPGSPPFTDGTLLGGPGGSASGSLDCPSGQGLVGLTGTYDDYFGSPDIYSLTGICDFPAPQQQSQTITWPQQGPYTYGQGPVALTATASSGLPVSYTVLSGPCSVSGSTLTLGGAGSCVVQADQAGNASYFPATSVQRTITINKAPTALAVARASYGFLTITYSAKLTSQVTGAGIPGQPVTFKASTGLPPCTGTTNSSGVASCSQNGLVIRVGTVTYSATYAGNANYLGSTGTGPL